ncbi:MAG: sodium:calcium antiporter [Chloroflexota bacterium]|nr:sodium:calcium antiporter [Chloroflexota bacterium]
MTYLLLVGTMLLLLVACELFTNSVEWLGYKLGLSEGTIGSVLAAVGTALPETLIPIVAISRGGEAARSMSVGAILGAPFMLATLAMFVSGLAVVLMRGMRRESTIVHADMDGMSRDVSWFLLTFGALLVGALLPGGWPRVLLALALLLSYAVYITKTVAHTEQEGQRPPALRFGGVKPNMFLVVLQLVFSLALLLTAAQGFVTAVQDVAKMLNVPLMALSLLIVPVATELPEKFNSVVWLARRRDTLAIGNITGAMVFQAAIPGAIGLLFTSWEFDRYSWLSSALAAGSMVLMWLWLRSKKPLPALLLLFGGLLYAIYVAFVVV